MTTEEVLQYFEKKYGSPRGAQRRFAEELNITPQYANKIILSGEIPFHIQCELEIRTKGKLKADRDLF